MDADFWHEKWRLGQINFHEAEENVLLTANWGALGLAPETHVFVPLSGKTRDIGWLLAQGHRVSACELSETAIDELFAELQVPATKTQAGPLLHVSTSELPLDVYVGDVFDVTHTQLGEVHGVYDRAAVVALPEAMRARYTKHVADICQVAPQLVVGFDYDQSKLKGPPFAVPATAISDLYGDLYETKLVERRLTPGGLKSLSEVYEEVWQLVPR